MIAEFHTRQFSYTVNSFSAEISDFGCNGIDSTAAKFFSKLDTGGYGFILVSDKTGKRIIMKLVKTEKEMSDWNSDDQDVVAWVFRPLNPRDGRFSLTIFND